MPPLPLSDEPYVLPPPESGIWTRVAEAWRRKWLAERRARHQEWQRACEREQEVLQEKDNIVKELCRRFRVVEVAWRRRLAEAEQLLAAASPGSTGALNTPSPPLPADGPRSPVRPTSPQTAPATTTNPTTYDVHALLHAVMHKHRSHNACSPYTVAAAARARLFLDFHCRSRSLRDPRPPPAPPANLAVKY
eukprot:TRINITY_DN15565_c0_g1_i4.p1 TRINITY_DN15565_c0_g1~~TRINITY_DN15565_c0_g1_i4.p1  ORF type:complete len:218 (+),score=21.88 TRINITY_DN15565_c0_g1_i4:81-656(+)